jgi:hypothetical protein
MGQQSRNCSGDAGESLRVWSSSWPGTATSATRVPDGPLPSVDPVVPLPQGRGMFALTVRAKRCGTISASKQPALATWVTS